MKKISKYLLTLITFFLLAGILTACASGSSTFTDSEEDTTSLEGLWVYEGPADQDPTSIVNLVLDKDGTFTIEANNDIMLAQNPTENTTNIEGTYLINDEELELTIDKITHSTDVDSHVEEGKSYTLTYELSADNNVIELTGISEILKDLPDTIELSKSNQ